MPFTMRMSSRKCCREGAELLRALVDKHPTRTIYGTCDNAVTHQDDKVEAVVRAAAGRLVLLYLPTYNSWNNPIEMLWRHFRQKLLIINSFNRLRLLSELPIAGVLQPISAKHPRACCTRCLRRCGLQHSPVVEIR
jgi:transposase